MRPQTGDITAIQSTTGVFNPIAAKRLRHGRGAKKYPITLVELFIAERAKDVWDDFVAVFCKGRPQLGSEDMLLCNRVPCTNVWRFDKSLQLFSRDVPEECRGPGFAIAVKHRLKPKLEADR